METENTAETRKHIMRVQSILHQFAKDLLDRADRHDASKLESPEVEVFEEYTGKLRGMTYGSEKYKTCLAGMKPALDHHYANNRHHPEHHPDGILGMGLVDLLELLADWSAAAERHPDGNIYKSLEINAGRFKIPDALVTVLRNEVARRKAGCTGWA